MRDDVSRWITTFSTAYARRWMEHHYDNLMSSDMALPVMRMSKPARYGVEAGLYAAFGVLEQVWPDQTLLQQWIKEVGMDAPSEIGKRLVNGFREEVLARADQKNDLEPALRALADMDDDTIMQILRWLDSDSKLTQDQIRQAIQAVDDARISSPETSTGKKRNTPLPQNEQKRIGWKKFLNQASDTVTRIRSHISEDLEQDTEKKGRNNE